MVDRARASGSPNGIGSDMGPGIAWMPGDEDYPFAAQPGESAFGYFERWLKDAPYARIDRAGAIYVHETDLINVVNHITADVGLLRARLDEFGDYVLTGADQASVVQEIDEAVARLTVALATLGAAGRTAG
jgi:hypothetical protein